MLIKLNLEFRTSAGTGGSALNTCRLNYIYIFFIQSSFMRKAFFPLSILRSCMHFKENLLVTDLIFTLQKGKDPVLLHSPCAKSTLKVTKEIGAPCDTGHHSKYKLCSWQHGKQLTAKFIPFIPRVSALAESETKLLWPLLASMLNVLWVLMVCTEVNFDSKCLQLQNSIKWVLTVKSCKKSDLSYSL